jgi:hypothetical protein
MSASVDRSLTGGGVFMPRDHADVFNLMVRPNLVFAAPPRLRAKTK